MKEKPLRIVVVDDHQMFREGLRFLLRSFAERLEFTEAGSLAALREVERPGTVDLVLLDYHLPDAQDLEGLRRVREVFEAAAVVVISGEDDPFTIRKVIRHGAAGFIPKASSSQVLVAALRLVIAGGTYLPPEILAAGDEGDACACRAEKDTPLESLTERQREVLGRAIQGKANKVIARELAISDHTVKVHLSLALKVLGVKNRTEAVFAAARWGMKQA